MSDPMRRTDAEIMKDNELLIKFYRREVSKCLDRIRSRDQFIIEMGLLKEFSEWTGIDSRTSRE